MEINNFHAEVAKCKICRLMVTLAGGGEGGTELRSFCLLSVCVILCTCVMRCWVTATANGSDMASILLFLVCIIIFLLLFVCLYWVSNKQQHGNILSGW